MDRHGNCDVCDRERDLYVACSPLGAISLAYCKECIENRAVSTTTLTAIADSTDELHPSVVEKYCVYEDGEYQPLEAAFN